MSSSLVSLFIVFGLWVCLAFLCAAPSNRNRGSTVSSSTSTTDYQLELLSYRGERGYSYLTVEGQVKNISGDKLEGVWAVVECYGSDGSLITSEDGVLEYTPLMPGQTSPFKVMIRDNPLIQTFKVNFKYLFAGTIPFKDSSTVPSTKTKKNRK